MSARRRPSILAWALWVLGLTGSLITQTAFAHDTVYYYYTNTLHSAVVETDAQGTVIERTYYAPYGQVLNRDMRDGPGYTGKQEDPATGLVYMQQRYYDPQSGRFLSTDPVQVTANGANFNRYWYAKDNPYRYTDPFGEYTCSGSKTNCGAVTNFYNSAVKSMGNMKKGSGEYKATAAAVKYLGKPGVKNGVTVTVATLKPGINGDAPQSGLRISVSHIESTGSVLAGRFPGKTTAEVQNAIGAGVLAHEATHEVDYRNVGYPHSRSSDRTTEVHAYTEEKGVRNALGVPRSDLSTPQGFNNAVGQSVSVFCSDSRNGC